MQFSSLAEEYGLSWSSDKRIGMAEQKEEVGVSEIILHSLFCHGVCACVGDNALYRRISLITIGEHLEPPGSHLDHNSEDIYYSFTV